jgi:hypothetical protein
MRRLENSWVSLVVMAELIVPAQVSFEVGHVWLVLPRLAQ